MSNNKKNPNRVRGGHKAYRTRLAHERDKYLVNSVASLIPGYGVTSNFINAAQTQRKFKNTTKRKKVTKRKFK